MIKKIILRQHSYRWHQKLAWPVALALFFFVLSALTHILMVWTGPQAATLRPPQAKLSTQQVQLTTVLLQKHKIEKALLVQWVPSQLGMVLQVTQSRTEPRRYFHAKSQKELLDFDEKHAIWLARHYAFNKNNNIVVKNITLQKEFTHAYPWVNRLLPVYKVTFNTTTPLTVYIDTEINALAGVSNQYRTILQRVFRVLHTWHFLDDFPKIRLILMTLTLVLCLCMLFFGIGLWYSTKKRTKMPVSLKWHRIIATSVSLPLLCFLISGVWHLLASDNDATLTTHNATPFTINTTTFDANAFSSWSAPFNKIQKLSIVPYQADVLLRASLPDKSTPPRNSRQARFTGSPTEQKGRYYSLNTQREESINDKEYAVHLARQYLRLPNSSVSSIKKIRRFGAGYDFRNKRLPVWRVHFKEHNTRVFVDPATGKIIDFQRQNNRYEAWSFSQLHKWDFMRAIVGRGIRDIIMSILLLAILAVIFLGCWRARLKRRITQ